MSNFWAEKSEALRNPPAAFRGKPFWAWNGALDPEELRRQIRVMHRMGLGGFFMHARVGLATPYLGDDWFACVDACVDEAAKLGMEAWLYDEDRWPSGAAGGLVTRNPAFRRRDLRARVVDRAVWGDDVLAVVRLEILDGQTVANVRPLERDAAAPKKKSRDRLVEFRVVPEVESSWYNGQTYLDTMNPEAVREFIRVTHETYKRRCGEHFGKRIPGIFTDEPFQGHPHLPPSPDGETPAEDLRLSWTAAIPDEFRRTSGRDLDGARLAELFWDVKDADAAETRWHYHEALTSLFVGSFAKQIGEWCAENGIGFTGHVVEEDTLSSQTACVGSAMRFYEYMQTPGMDLLTEHWRIYPTAKQVSSAARQFDRPWRLTETYGCTGWDFPFRGHKALGDWQVALGINLRCQHLYWHTMLGEAKRDYPAAIGHQSPWWEHYAKVEDYFARVQRLMTRGKEIRDLLMIHPVESRWLDTRAGWRESETVRADDRAFTAVGDALLAATIDFDYGDEELLSRHARVESGSAEGAPWLRVGAAVYKAVLVPAGVRTIRSSTLALLRRFRDAGGRVVFAGDGPERVDARPDGAARAFAAEDGVVRVPAAPGRALALAVENCRRVSVSDGHGQEIAPILHLLREDDEAFYLFLVNVGHDFTGGGAFPGQIHEEPMARDRRLVFDRAVVVCAPEAAGRPVEYDPDANVFFAVDARRSPAGWEIETSFPALGSRLFVFPKNPDAERDKAARKLPSRKAATVVRREALGVEAWDFTRSENNVLLLDRPRLRLADGPWQEADNVLSVDRRVREALGIRKRGGAMVQPWAQPVPDHPKRVAVALVYEFGVDTLPDGEVLLALERPETFRISLNGRPVDQGTGLDRGVWVDASLRCLSLPGDGLRVGVNELRLEIDYPETHSGLEYVYLLGDFGVAVSGTAVRLTAPPRRLALGDWTEQGLPFYAGHVAYRLRTTVEFDPKTERVRLRIPEYAGTAARVLVDGRVAGVVAWEPQVVDLTGFVRSGAPFDLAVQVLGHRRNSHGPFHFKDTWPTWTGPGEFVREGGDDPNWREDYALVPCGLMAEPELLYERIDP